MKTIIIFLLLLLSITSSKAQSDEAILKWLSNHISSINVGESSFKATYNSPYDGKFDGLRFNQYGIKAIGEAKDSFITSSRKYFNEATIENNFLVLKERTGDITKLSIADPAMKLQFKEVITRFAYTQLNTNEADLPIYDSTAADKKAEFPGGADAWRKFLERNFSFDPTVKHKTPPGKYAATMSFVVTKDSMLKDFKKLGNNPKGVDECFLRLMLKAPRWTPATLNGKKVSSTVVVRMTINVRPRDPDDDNDRMEESHVELYYKPLDINLFNYENNIPGYKGLKPLNLGESSNTPAASTKTDTDKKNVAISKTKAGTDVKLTKMETVAYLNKKYKEAEGLIPLGNDKVTVRECKIEFAEGLLIVSRTLFEQDKLYGWVEYKFNPLYISNITQKTSGANISISKGGLSALEIKLTSNSVVRNLKFSDQDQVTNIFDNLPFDFAFGDGQNFEKIKKALLHLQALLKEEDDPF